MKGLGIGILLTALLFMGFGTFDDTGLKNCNEQLQSCEIDNAYSCEAERAFIDIANKNGVIGNLGYNGYEYYSFKTIEGGTMNLLK